MAERLAYLEAVVGADITQFRKGMRDIRNDVGILSETIGGLGKLGRTMTFTVTAPLLALGSMAVQSASEFESAMYNINAIAGMSAAALDDLSARTLEFGKNTRAGAITAAEALYTVYSAGIIETEAAFVAMEWSVRTAEAGVADLTTTTEAMVASILSYGDTSETFTERASNALTAMVAVGVGSMEEFAGAVGSVLPTASALDMSIEELYGDMAYLTQRGLNASRASTALNSALTALVKPTNAMQAAFAQLGVGGAEELIEKFGGVNAGLQALIGTTDGSQQALQALFNNIRGARAINLFAQDIDAWNTSMGEFNELADGATMRAWEEQMKSFAAQWDLLTSALQGAGIAIGQQIMPLLIPAVHSFTDFLNSVSSLNPELLQLGVMFAGVAAAAGPVLWILASVLNPVGMLTGAVVGLSTAWKTNFNGMRDDISAAVQDIAGDLGWLKEVWDAFWTGIFPEKPFDPSTLPAPSVLSVQDFITVESDQSLYSIWEDQFKDIFDWDEFYQEIMPNAGWEGGAITPEDNFVIDLTGMAIELPNEEFQAEMDEFLGLLDFSSLEEAAPAGPSLVDRLLGSWAIIKPVLDERLGQIWDNVKTWADEKIGAGLDLIAGWFTLGEGGESPITGVLEAMLSGNFDEAINRVIPGAGTKLYDAIAQDWPGKFAAALPNITAGASNLVNSIGTWFVDEGIPLIANKIGYWAGRVGILLREGLQSVWNWFTGSGVEGSGAESVGSYLGENVFGELQAGFTEAMGDGGAGGMQTGAEQILDALAGALVVVAVTGAVFMGVGPAISTGLGIALTGLKIGIPAIASIGTSLVTGIGTWIASSTVGTAVMSGISMALAGLGIGALGITLSFGVILGALLYLLVPPEVREAIKQGVQDTVGEVVADLAGYDTWEQAELGLAGWLQEAAADSIGVFDEDAAERLRHPGQQAGEVAVGSYVDGFKYGLDNYESQAQPFFFTPEFIMENPDVDFSNLENWQINSLLSDNAFLSNLDLFTNEGVAVFNKALIDFQAGYGLFQDELLQILEEGGMTWEEYELLSPGNATALQILAAQNLAIAVQNGDWTIDENGIPITPLDLDAITRRLIGTPGGPMLDAGDVSQGVAPLSLGEQIFNAEDIQVAADAASLAVDNGMTAMGESFVQHMGEGTMMDAQRINDEFLVPLETFWLTAFGTASPMYTTFQTFSDDMVDDLDNINLGLEGMVIGITEGMPPMLAVLQRDAPMIVHQMAAVAEAAQDAATAVRDLLSIEGHINVSVDVSTDTPDGSHYSGLFSVPYDGYVAELHQGERVLTAKEADAYQASIPANVVTPSEVVSNTAHTENYITVQGVTDVDTFLKEMKRRGIKID